MILPYINIYIHIHGYLPTYRGLICGQMCPYWSLFALKNEPFLELSELGFRICHSALRKRRMNRDMV